MKREAYITREGGLLVGHATRAHADDGLSLACYLSPIASCGGASPHFYCAHCARIFVKIGQDYVRCETPSLCVVSPLKILDRRKGIRRVVQAGPLSRGLL